MTEPFIEILAAGGKTNSLGRADEVITATLKDKKRLSELYDCLFANDPWIRMRAADALEKICRVNPDWLLPYIDKFADELATSSQASIQWHLAQIYGQVELTKVQKEFAINWLKNLLSSTEVDWIVAANSMDTLVKFVHDGSVTRQELITLLNIQRKHKSKSVVKRANKIIGLI